MKQPLLILTLTYVIGILVGSLVPVAVWLLFGLAFLLVALIWKNFGKTQLYIYPLLFLTAWANFAWRTQELSPHDLRTVVREGPVLAKIRGEISHPLVERLRENDGEESWSTQVRATVSEVQLDGGDWQPASGQVLATLPDLLGEEYYAGRTIEIDGVLQKPPVALIDGLFDYRKHLYWRGIYYQLVTEGPADFSIIDGRPLAPPLSARFQKWARATLLNGLPETDEAVRLLYAMTLGWRTNLGGEVAEPFMQSGTMHIFAISGLHIAVIAGILVQVFRLFGMSRSRCAMIIIPMLWFYAMATGWQPSAIRATLMTTVILAGWSLKRPANLLNSICFAALVILLYEPREIFHVGFQLSFAVVTSIALILPKFDGWKERFLGTDNFLPPELRPRWQRVLDLPVRFFVTSFATSLAAWLGSLPIIALYFNLFTPVSLLANLAVVPLSGFAIMSVMGSWMTGPLLPGLSVLFNHGAWFWMTLMMNISEWSASFRWGWLYVASPSWTVVVFYYLVLTGWVSGWIFSSKRNRLTAAGATALFVLVISMSNLLDDDVTISVLPAYGGDVIYVDRKGRGNDLLIDTGNEFAAERITKPFLKSRGVNTLSALAMTHGDVSHIGGVSYLEANFKIDQIVTSQVAFRSSYYADVVERLEESPEQWVRLEAESEHAGWKLLHPPSGSELTVADDNAMVLFSEIHGVKVLLLSDLGRLGQLELAGRFPDLKADIVVAGVPESDGPVKDYLLDLLQPGLLIVSASDRTFSNYAGRALRERLSAHDFPVIFTSDAGGVLLSMDKRETVLRKSGEVLWQHFQAR